MELNLYNNPALTKAQIDQLQKALPKCFILSNPPLNAGESSKVIDAAIRKAAKKPTGELTKANYEKVERLKLNDNQLTSVKGLEKLTQLWHLNLNDNQLTSVKGLEKLTKLEVLYLYKNPDLTKAQIAELQKALPKCKIYR
jgi:16S rRNA G1207 methylase RsmC